MSLLMKRVAVNSVNIATKYYSTVKQQISPNNDIPMDRVFENVKTGTKFVLTNDYSVAKNGINDRNEFVLYYPEKLMPSYHNLYDDIKSSSIDFITKFNIAKPDTKRFRDIMNLRCDAMSALTLVTDAPNTDNAEFVRAYNDNMLFTIINDDLMVKLIPHAFIKFEQQYIEKLKAVHCLNSAHLFDKNDSTLSYEETELVSDANNLILALHDLCARLRKHCSANVYANYCVSNCMLYDCSAIENNLIRQNKPLTWNQYLDVSIFQTGVHGFWSLNDHSEPQLPLFDPFLSLGMFYTRLFNDVLSHWKERQTLENACINGVSVLMSMNQNLNTMQAMIELMRIQNKILHDMVIYVGYLREEQKHVYTNVFKHCIGFTEGQLLSTRFSWKRISGSPSKYETFEHNGVIYGSDDNLAN